MAAGCIFCRIARGEAEADVVHRGDRLTAFHDSNPQAPVHVLVIPNRHVESVNELEEGDADLVGEMVLLAGRLARELDVATSGYRLVINTGAQAGQSVPHLHLHLLGGRALRWPPG
jgi:histidine triad (HIT) family protein